MLQKALQRDLQELQLKAVIKSDLFKPLLNDVLQTIKSEAKKSKNEATIESAFEISLYGLLSQIGIKLFPEKEKRVDTLIHVNRGRIDSSIGAFITEFKHYSKLETRLQINEATQQIKEYMIGLAKENNESYFIGAITDGLKIKFVMLQDKSFSEELEHDISIYDIIRLIKNIVSLQTKALTPKNLVGEFCDEGEQSLATRLVKALYKTLKNSATARTHMLNSEWERLFKLGHEDKSKQKTIEERGAELSKVIGKESLPIADQYKVLFSIQTAYAIIIKLIAYRVISDIVFRSPLQSFKSLAKSNSTDLRIFFSEFEDGATFREVGIDNLLEGDFFAWYCAKEQWNKELYSVLTETISRLANYEDKQDIFNKSNINDLFREFYLKIMPSIVRYSLGEFYVEGSRAKTSTFRSRMKPLRAS